MSDSVTKYFESTSTSNFKTIYPGDIQVTVDTPKKDSYVQIVKAKFEERSQRGIKKYGTNLEREDLDIFEWLNHLQEELMDATLYVERLKAEIGDKLRDR
jgi:hypothetical protein